MNSKPRVRVATTVLWVFSLVHSLVIIAPFSKFSTLIVMWLSLESLEHGSSPKSGPQTQTQGYYKPCKIHNTQADRNSRCINANSAHKLHIVVKSPIFKFHPWLLNTLSEHGTYEPAVQNTRGDREVQKKETQTLTRHRMRDVFVISHPKPRQGSFTENNIAM